MDNLTHTLFALTLARTPLGRAGRGTTTALVLASNAPDIDIIATARGNAAYLQWHRGPTHGLLGIAGLGILTAVLVWALQRYVDGRTDPPDEVPSASFGMLAVVSAVGVLCHILMDFPTSYGTRLLSPFSWHWFAADLMPIVDVYLIAALFAGLLFGSTSEASRRRNAAIVLVLMAANYGVRAVARHEAIALAPRVFGPLMPPPCDPNGVDRSLVVEWPHALGATWTASTAGTSRCLVEMAAMPTFTSPFRWRLIAQLSNAYEMHDLDVLDARLRRPAEVGEAPWRVAVRYPQSMECDGASGGRCAPRAGLSWILPVPRSPMDRRPTDRRVYRAMDGHAIRRRSHARPTRGSREPIHRDRPPCPRRPDSRRGLRPIATTSASNLQTFTAAPRCQLSSGRPSCVPARHQRRALLGHALASCDSVSRFRGY